MRSSKGLSCRHNSACNTSPTWAEYGVVVGLFGLVALAILVFVRIFPIVPTLHAAPPRQRAKRDWVRFGATTTTLLGAVLLIAVGLSDSFRMWSGSDIDPRIPFAPAIFASGVMLLFVSAIVYETMPRKPRPLPEPRREHPAPRAPRQLRAGVKRVDASAHIRSSREVRSRS